MMPRQVSKKQFNRIKSRRIAELEAEIKATVARPIDPSVGLAGVTQKVAKIAALDAELKNLRAFTFKNFRATRAKN